MVPVKEQKLMKGGNSISEVEEDKLKSAVCFLWRPLGDGTHRKVGSGFYVSLKTKSGKIIKGIMTNHHVIENEEIAANTNVVFFHDGKSKSETIKLRPEKNFVTGGKVLDFTIIGCDENYVENTLKIFPIQYVPNTQYKEDDAIVIYQHPAGRPREKSTQKITRIEDRFITYHADTEGGSSGSPVFQNWNLIAVHYQGSANENFGLLIKNILLYLEMTGNNTEACLFELSPGQSSNNMSFDDVIYTLTGIKLKKMDTIKSKDKDLPVAISEPTVPVAVDGDSDITVDSYKYKLDEKMMIYKLSRHFAGRKGDGKRFCEVFTGYNECVEKIFGNSDKSDDPVLEVMAQTFSTKGYPNPLEVVNDALKKSKNNRMTLDQEDNPFTNLNASINKDFTKNNIRIPAFRTISNKCTDVERYIAHFLLPYQEIITIMQNKPNDIKERLNEILDTWCRSYEWNKWPYLRSLLLFLDKGLVVDEIEGQ